MTRDFAGTAPARDRVPSARIRAQSRDDQVSTVSRAPRSRPRVWRRSDASRAGVTQVRELGRARDVRHATSNIPGHVQIDRSGARPRGAPRWLREDLERAYAGHARRGKHAHHVPDHVGRGPASATCAYGPDTMAPDDGPVRCVVANDRAYYERRAAEAKRQSDPQARAVPRLHVLVKKRRYREARANAHARPSTREANIKPGKL
jgi:hypothetical protein